ncbi:MAG: hypothetical protein IT548_04220 [Alphaproteobacteria bacterium]|nr:hypothetical protein [Alphaproteobacteria bacterium]
MRVDACADQPGQRRVHEIVVVRNIQANDLRPPEVASEPAGQPPPMRRLHDEDDVDAVKVIRGERFVGVRRKAGRRDLKRGVRRIDRLGGRAVPAIAAAYEENAQARPQSSVNSTMTPPATAAGTTRPE